jgi:hypothetical protein
MYVQQETGRAHLDAGLKLAGYSGVGDQRLNGLDASIQVIQLGERGSALYNVCLQLHSLLRTLPQFHHPFFLHTP